MTTANVYARVKDLSEQPWRLELHQFVEEPIQSATRYPNFPDESTQQAWTGSATADVMNDPFASKRFVETAAAGAARLLSYFGNTSQVGKAVGELGKDRRPTPFDTLLRRQNAL